MRIEPRRTRKTRITSIHGADLLVVSPLNRPAYFPPLYFNSGQYLHMLKTVFTIPVKRIRQGKASDSCCVDCQDGTA